MGRGKSKYGDIRFRVLGVRTRKTNFRSPLLETESAYTPSPSSALRQLKVVRPQPRSQTRATNRLILLSLSGDFNGSAQLQNFSQLRMRADLNNFWWTWEPTRRTFKKMWCLFFLAEKKFRIHNRNFSVVNSDFFSAKTKDTKNFESSPCWLPGPPKII